MSNCWKYIYLNNPFSLTPLYKTTLHFTKCDYSEYTMLLVESFPISRYLYTLARNIHTHWPEIFICTGPKYLCTLARNIYSHWPEIFMHSTLARNIYTHWAEISMHTGPKYLYPLARYSWRCQHNWKCYRLFLWEWGKRWWFSMKDKKSDNIHSKGQNKSEIVRYKIDCIIVLEKVEWI